MNCPASGIRGTVYPVAYGKYFGVFLITITSDARVGFFFQPTGPAFMKLFGPPQPAPHHCIYFSNPPRPAPATIK